MINKECALTMDVGEGVQFKVTRCIKHATALLKSTVGDEVIMRDY